MVGHVTKDGSLAGPKVLEHCIDCSVLLDGDADSRFRTLRSHKNRFGAVNELGVFAMTEQGLREVSNPSAIFLSRGDEVTSGSSVMVVWEGTRAKSVRYPAARSVFRKRRSTAFAGRLSLPLTYRKKYRKGCRSLALRSLRMR